MLNQKEISHLKHNEKELLFNINVRYGDLLEIHESILEDTLHIRIKSPVPDNDIEIFYHYYTMVLSIGKWTHTHPETIEDLLLTIDKIIDEEIIVWKVTFPDGNWSAGHYDIYEWEKNPHMVDEPDTNLERGDWIERSTFKRIIENKIIE